MQAENSTNYHGMAPSPIIVALDYASQHAAMTFADSIDPRDCHVKVGKALFTLAGPGIVRDLQQRGFKVFLDLKFHDIPETTARAVAAAAEIGVWMVNVHASGGARMMKAAENALRPYGSEAPLLIAVTVLTSMQDQDLRETGVAARVEDQVKLLATMASDCGLDGIVCSAEEASVVKQSCGQAFCLVTPGIRLQSSPEDDQRRVMTPHRALAAGADWLVIGRPVTQSAHPARVLREILTSLEAP